MPVQWSRVVAAAVFVAAPPVLAAEIESPVVTSLAQSAPDSGSEAISRSVQPIPNPCGCVIVPALTIVDIEILAPLSSATSRDGDIFPIRLASPIHMDGREVISAGATGIGEVIHAQKSGMGGGGGELLLAARYLDVNGSRLRLRSFRAGRYGKNQTGTALVTSVLAGPFGLAVKGKNTEFAAGSIAEAKVAEAFSVPLSALPRPESATSDDPVPAPISTEAESALEKGE